MSWLRPIMHAILALILLVATTVLGVYKPFGMTAYGEWKLEEQRQAVSATIRANAVASRAVETGTTPAWIYVVGAVALALAVLAVILHLTGASPTHH